MQHEPFSPCFKVTLGQIFKANKPGKVCRGRFVSVGSKVCRVCLHTGIVSAFIYGCTGGV